jgi:hypothetical protein
MSIKTLRIYLSMPGSLLRLSWIGEHLRNLLASEPTRHVKKPENELMEETSDGSPSTKRQLNY